MSATSEFVRNLRVEVDERPAPTPVKKETQPVVKKERKDDDEEMQDAEEGEEKENENEEDDENQGDDVMDEPLVSGSLAAALQFLKQKGTNQPFEAYLVLQGISFY